MKIQASYFSHIFRKITASFKNTDFNTVVKQCLTCFNRQKIYEFLKNFIRHSFNYSYKKIFLFIGLVSYLLFLIFPYPLSSFELTRNSIFNSDEKSAEHLILSVHFQKAFDYANSLKELNIAYQINPESQIQNEIVMTKNFLDKPARLQENLLYWKNVSRQKPGYRDAFFQQAIIYYQLKNFPGAKEVLQKVFELDPNFMPGRKLEKALP